MASAQFAQASPGAERQAITSQGRAWAPEVVSRKPRPVTIPARVRPPCGTTQRTRSSPQVGSELHFDHSVPPTIVMQEPHVDGVLDDRGVSFQMPLTRFILAPSGRAGCIRTDQAGRAQETEQPRRSCGTFVAHKSEKHCSAGSASVNEPRTKRSIASLLCWGGVALIIRRSKVQAPAAPLGRSRCVRPDFAHAGRCSWGYR